MVQDNTCLRDLCGICFTEKPKYCCPGCETRTCSLPCYKRHQQRASCNGKRDPASYLKKNQLATPLGIDRDYNYLKSVEREIELAHKDVLERGVGKSSKILDRAINPAGALQRYLIANRIHVTRAPKGMNRQRSNNTRHTKRGYIMWTVEWVNGESREIQENCRESSSIQDLYGLKQLERRNAVKRGLTAESRIDRGSDPKRLRRHVRGAKDDSPDQTSAPPPEKAELAADPQVNTVTGEAQSHLSTESTSQATPESATDGADQRPQSKPELIDPDASSDDHSDQDSRPDSKHGFFYLLKPNTPSRSKILIPLSPHATLTDCLRDQTVLEYPTIYVLPQDGASLPPGFTNEEEFLAAQKREEAEFTDAVQKAQKAGVLSPAALPPAPPSKSLDPQKILDVLKRDLTR